jgi:hypothetical protein
LVVTLRYERVHIPLSAAVYSDLIGLYGEGELSSVHFGCSCSSLRVFAHFPTPPLNAHRSSPIAHRPSPIMTAKPEEFPSALESGEHEGPSALLNPATSGDEQVFKIEESRKLGVTSSVFLILNKMIGTGS